MNRLRAVQALAWAAATLLLVACFRAVEWSALRETAGALQWPLVAVAGMVNAVGLAIWAALWWLVVPRGEHVAYRRMFEITAIAAAIMNSVPFLAGHASAVAMLERSGGMSRPGALVVLTMDQLGEGLSKLAVFAALGAIGPFPVPLRAAIVGTTVLVAVFLTAVTIASRMLPGQFRLAGRLTRVMTFVRRWAGGLDTLRSPTRSALALALALSLKVVEGAAMVLVQRALGVDLPLAATVLVLTATMLGTMIPLAPANLGTYEASAFVAYRYAGVAPDQALAIAVAQHLALLLPTLGIGYGIASVRHLAWWRSAPSG